MPQAMPPSYMAYDRAITVFSPDGRLLQVEYARETVKAGSTAIGLCVKNAVILASIRSAAPLTVLKSFKKVFPVDDHIAIAYAGLNADARSLVEVSRVRAQINRVTYNEPISVQSLTTYICDRMHTVTQYGGVRPYGVGLLVGGVDASGPKLFETEPSGTLIEWHAQAIGRGAEKAKKALEKDFDPGMDLKAGMKIVLHAMKAGEKDVDAASLDLVVVSKDKVEAIPEDEVKRLL